VPEKVLAVLLQGTLVPSLECLYKLCKEKFLFMFTFDREGHVDFGTATCINSCAPTGSGIKPEKLCKYKTVLSVLPQMQK
jgi:hypothetical protein